MNTEKIGAYLASLRKNRNMTQQEVAEQLGVSNKTVSKWESGGGLPDIGALPAIAALYGVTADDILAGETRPRQGGCTSGEVTAYLEQRSKLRFNICYTLALLCAVTSWVFRWYTWALIPLAAAPLCLWIGWGRCEGEQLRRRLLVIQPLVIACIYWLSNMAQWWTWLADLVPYWAYLEIKESALWLWLLLLLLGYCLIGNAIALRPLLQSVAVRRTALLSWALLVAAEIARIVVGWKPAMAYIAMVTGYGGAGTTRAARRLAEFDAVNTPLLWVRWILLIAGIAAIAVTALRQKKKENGQNAEST